MIYVIYVVRLNKRIEYFPIEFKRITIETDEKNRADLLGKVFSSFRRFSLEIVFS